MERLVPLLPPPDHIPVSVASVYLIANILVAETNRAGTKDETASYLRKDQRPYAVMRSRNPEEEESEIFELTASGLEIVKDQSRPYDSFSAGGVRISFQSKDGKVLYKAVGPTYPARDVRDINVTLLPPYQTCLNADRVRDQLNRAGLARLVTRIPERFALVLSASVARSAVSSMRQALAARTVDALMIEEDGRETRVPEHFWRTDKAEVVLAQDVPVSMPVEGRTAIGHIFMRIQDIKDGWEQIIDIAPVHRRVSEPLFSPYIELAKQVSINLGLEDGRARRGQRVGADRVRQEVSDLWNEFILDPKAKTEAKIDSVTTLIRHPEDGRGGYLSNEAPKAKITETGAKKRRQPRPTQNRRREKA